MKNEMGVLGTFIWNNNLRERMAKLSFEDNWCKDSIKQEPAEQIPIIILPKSIDVGFSKALRLPNFWSLGAFEFQL